MPAVTLLYIVFAAVNIYCIWTALIILFKTTYSIGSQLEIRIFRGMTLLFLGFVVLELIWSLAHLGVLPISTRAASTIKIISTLLIPVKVFLWFWFAETRFRSRFASSRVIKILSAIPLVVMFALYLVSTRTGIVFSISPSGELIQGPLAALTGIVDNFYGILIIVHAVILMIGEKERYRRQEYLTQIVFIVICTLGGIFDAVAGDAPIMPLAIALAFNFLFMNLLEGQIYSDALTGLNNRRSADRYLAASMQSASAEDPFHLFILDVDHFKKINDTMGHLEGDRALQAVSAAIQNAANAHGGYAARWGGDEFLVIIRNRDFSFPEKFVAELPTYLD